MASNSNPRSQNPSLNELRTRNNLLKELEDANENKGPSVVLQTSSRKILGDRNSNNTPLSNMPKTLLENNPKNEKLLSGPHKKNHFFEKIRPLSDSSSTAYDPVTNYTSPRPAFLRYNPNRHKEILSRMEDCASEESLSEENLLSSSSTSSKSKDEEKQLEEELAENEEEKVENYTSDYEDLEAENGKFWYSANVCKWFFLFVIMLALNYYLFSSNGPLQEKNSSVGIFHRSTYKLRGHMGVNDVCFYIGNEICDLVISDEVTISDTFMIDESKEKLSSLEESVVSSSNFNDVSTNNDLRAHEHKLSVTNSVESMHESTIIDEKLVIDNGSEVAMSADEFLLHELSNEIEEIQKVSSITLDAVANSDDSKGALHANIVSSSKFDVVLTNNDLRTIDAHEPSVNKSGEWMHESTNIGDKLVNDNDSEVVMSTYEFLIHELSNEIKETPKEAEYKDKDGLDESEFNSESRYEVRNQFDLFTLFSGCLSSVIFGLWIAISMCFSKSSRKVKVLNATTTSSSNHSKNQQKESFILPCAKSVEDNNSKEFENEGNGLNFFNQSTLSCKNERKESFNSHRAKSVGDNKSKESENKGKDLNLVIQSSSSSPKDESMGFYASRTPTIELLSEFSIVDDLKLVNSEFSKSKKYESSELSKSQDGRSRVEKFQRPIKSAKIVVNSSPSSGGIANEKQHKKEMMLATPTPVRRSSRLQKRVTSPNL